MTGKRKKLSHRVVPLMDGYATWHYWKNGGRFSEFAPCDNYGARKGKAS